MKENERKSNPEGQFTVDVNVSPMLVHRKSRNDVLELLVCHFSRRLSLGTFTSRA